jgi:hypothetical protein
MLSVATFGMAQTDSTSVKNDSIAWDKYLDGVTVTAGSMDPDSGSLEEGGSFSTTLRNFTKRMIDGRISPVSSAVWRAHRPQSSASASLFPANRNEFAKNVGVSTRNLQTFL